MMGMVEIVEGVGERKGRNGKKGVVREGLKKKGELGELVEYVYEGMRWLYGSELKVRG